MAITLTTAVNVGNITKYRVIRVHLDEDTSTALVDVEVGGAGGKTYGVFTLAVRNGSCDKLARTASPSGWNDLYGIAGQVTLATGFTDFVTAYTGASAAARNRAAETWLSNAARLLTEAGS